MMVYLDNAATTKPYEIVLKYMNEIQTERYGNPSSVHSMGMVAERELKNAGDKIARTLNTERGNLIFTSGGTEADNMAVMQPFFDMKKRGKREIVTSAVEHPAVNSPCDYYEDNGSEVVRINVNENGMIYLEQLEEVLKNDDKNISLISVMYVNNEVGTIQPINEICKIKSDYTGRGKTDLIFHTDAVQAYGKLPLDLSSNNNGEIDLMTLSAHKIHGPKGVGALFARDPNKIKPLLKGGGQQNNLRSGTENVAAIAGFGYAAEIQNSDIEGRMEKVAALRKMLLQGFLENIDNIKINSPMEVSLLGEAGKCIPSILSVSFIGTKAEVILHSLEQKGIYVSTESACSSKKRGSSPVLTAMGMNPDEIEGTLRFSISTFNTEDEIDYTIQETKIAVEKFRKLTGYRK